MKKVSIIVQEKDAGQAVIDLRSLGVLHVEPGQTAVSVDINLLQDEISLVTQAIDVFRQVGIAINKEKPQAAISGDWKIKARHIIEQWKRREHLEGYQQTLNAAIIEWQPWGDFDPHEIKELINKGLIIKLFQVPTRRLGEFPEDVIVKPVNSGAGSSYCLTISEHPFEVPFKEMPLHHYGLSQMHRRLEEDRKVMQTINDELLKESAYYQDLLNILKRLNKEMEYQRVLNTMAKEGKFSYITGFTPKDTVDALEKKAKEKAWAILIEEPNDEDNVPTLIRNPRWVEVISPVFQFLGIVPGYREMDISPLFLFFLSLFFGMIIGDAGYGAIYILLTFFLKKKIGDKLQDKRIFSLLFVFSSFAVFWGLVTGTVFGQEWYLKTGLKPIIPILNDTKFLQAFCFFLGALHLTLGQGWQALRKLPSLSALSDIGWISVLWAAFFLAKTLILDDPFPFFGKWLIIAGISLVIFCTSPQKNILKMIGLGLSNVALSLMNNFTDVVSYVRLFAVGLAGVAIADTVNTLAGLSGNVVAQVLIIFIGHSVNIVLGPMSVLVHGVRLNVLEFSGHAGLSWSGIAYKPFKE